MEGDTWLGRRQRGGRDDLTRERGGSAWRAAVLINRPGRNGRGGGLCLCQSKRYISGGEAEGSTCRSVRWRPSCPNTAVLVGETRPEKAASLSALYSVEGFPTNSKNSGDKYLTIIVAFFTPKRIFSCGLAVARTLAF